MKNLRKFMMGSGIAIALIASFAFKTASKQINTVVDIWDPVRSYECDLGYTAEGTCLESYHGPRCTVYYSSAHPAVPAFADVNGQSQCLYPVYLEN